MSVVLALCALLAVVPRVDEMRGPFPIMSTPYHEDGAVDYDALAREAQWTDECGCPGVIWCQSNDAVDLLTTEEKFRGFETCAKAVEGRKIVLALGANGTNTAEMLEIAAEIERVAGRHPSAKIAMISRPPDDARSQADIESAWDRLGRIAKRPVIFQTYGTKDTPTPSVELVVRLAERYPHAFGYVKEEAAGWEANERMLKECAAKPTMKTVFAGWGGWQWRKQGARHRTLRIRAHSRRDMAAVRERRTRAPPRRGLRHVQASNRPAQHAGRAQGLFPLSPVQGGSVQEHGLAPIRQGGRYRGREFRLWPQVEARDDKAFRPPEEGA